MCTERQLLFAVLAFEDDLLDLQQLVFACRVWASDKSNPLGHVLIERGWITHSQREFLEQRAERKLAKHKNDPRATLDAIVRGDVRDVLRDEVDDSEVRETLSAWPSAVPVLIETISQTQDELEQSKSRYTWISEVGTGGLGKVWLARDNDLAREVALKEIKPGSASSDAVRRLIKEAQITGQLQHPGIVPVYEVSHQGRPFYTMKLVRGETLSRAIREHHERKQSGQEDPLSERRLLGIFLSVCDALAYAHSRGVIHRDLKPDNIVLGDFGEAIVLDWGLARQVGNDDDESAPIVVTEDGRTEVTLAGQKLGTPAYMSPEQAAGRVDSMDQRTDVYGLGAILFEILTSRPPHRTQDQETTEPGQSPVLALLNRIATGRSPSVWDVDPSIPRELSEICDQAMAVKRGDRFQTAKELKEALLAFQVHEESIELSARATEDLEAARAGGTYDNFSRAQFGFETALEQWAGNTKAAAGLAQTQHDYARAAYDRGDFDLSLTLLDDSDSDQAVLATTVRAATSERAARVDRIRRLRRFGVAASLMIAIVASVAAVWINAEREKALLAQSEESKQRGIAERNAEKAIQQTDLAEVARAKAVTAEAVARTEADKARQSLQIAEQRAYNTDMLLVQREWDDTHLLQLKELLERHRDREDLRGFEWGYWDRLSHSDLLTLKGRGSGWNRSAFNPDRTRIAIATAGGKLTVWDTVSGQETLSFQAHSRRKIISSVLFSPDGTRIVSASQGDVKVWDAATGQEVFTLKGHTDRVYSVAFSPDGTSLASASWDGTVKTWDAVSGKGRFTLNGHSGRVFRVAFSPDGTKIASAGGNVRKSGEVKLWDVETGQEILTFKGHTGTVRCMIFSLDGTRIVSAGIDGTLKMWDAATGQEELSLKGHTYSVNEVVFSPNGMRLASAGLDNTVKVWDAATGEMMLTLEGHSDQVTDVAFNSDATRIASASNDHTVKVWDAGTGQEIQTLKGHTSFVTDVSFCADGTRIASGCRDGKVKLWDAGESQESLTLKGHTQPIWGLSFSPDGKRIASASGANNGTIYLPPDANTTEGVVKVWDAVTGLETLTLNGHGDSVNCVAFSPDGSTIASGSHDTSVKVWDAATGQERLTFEGHADHVTSVAFSPDGMRIASTSGAKHDSAGDVKVWDATTGQEALTFKGHAGGVRSVAFSPDGTRIASGSYDRTVKVWDSTTGQERLTLNGHPAWVYCVAFSPDGRRIASGTSGVVKVWNAATGKDLFTFKGHTSLVNSVAFSPDGTRLASASTDKTVKVWDMRTGQETITLKGHAGSVYGNVLGVAFSPDGTRLASASGDRTVKVWDARPWTPKLRAESRARGVLTLRRERVNSLEELRAELRANKTLSDMVRRLALDRSEAFWKARLMPR